MAAINGATESFTSEITHVSEGSSVEFTLNVTDDASGFVASEDLAIISVQTARGPDVNIPADTEVEENPPGTFIFSIQFPQVMQTAQYRVVVRASGVVGLSSDKSITITILKDIPITHTLGQAINFPVEIKGENVREVDVQGLLQEGLYHHWDEAAGMLYIRSIGAVNTSYKNLAFTISARDDAGIVDLGGSLNSSTPPAPAIRLPAEPLKFFFGRLNEIDLQIDHSPSKVEVIGTWLGLEAKKQNPGVRFQGTLPKFGSKNDQMTPGVNSGEFFVTASNAGGEAEMNVPWIIVTGKPQFRESSFRNYAAQNEAFTDTILIDGDPEPDIVIESGSLPTGLTVSKTYSNSVTTVSFTGTTTAIGTFRFKVKATNTEGSTISIEYTITVYTGLIAPSLNKQNRWGGGRRLRKNRFPLDLSPYFNSGAPPGTYTLIRQGRADRRDPEIAFAVSPTGELTVVDGWVGVGTRRYNPVIQLENSEGRIRGTFGITLQGRF